MGTRDEEAERAAIEMLAYMKRVAAKVAWNHADIDDVAQDGALRILLHFGTYRGGSLKGWTGMIAHNIAINHNHQYQRGVVSLDLIGSEKSTAQSPKAER